MRLGDERIKELQILLKELFDFDYTTEEAQEAGLAIMRFTLAKTQRQQELNEEEKKNEFE